MGCWNGTCLISNLPIMAGEPVVGYTLEYFSYKDEKDYSGSCYPNAKANPFGLPIYGTYDDYGGIESVDDNSLAVKYLLHLFGETDSEELLRDIERDNRTRSSTRMDEECGVGLVMINRHIVDRLVAAHIPTKYDVEIDKVVDGLKEMREFGKRKASLHKILKEDGDMMTFSSQLGLHVDMYEEKDYTEMIKFVLDQGDDDKIANEFAELLRVDKIIRDAMYRLRKIWIGQSGKGSQGRDYRTHLILADAIKEHIFSSFDGPEDAYLTLLGKRDW
ncbi:hypothetical protein LCGC14_2166140 [marine sediment metagenome]|uniref:Uncharacterized protein n=1 Tax=marine sediment metagenome TaxID=412755 RepID=A0A0F9DRH3_9ZZZZ